MTATSKGESRTRPPATARAPYRRRALVTVPAVALAGIVAGPAAPAAAGTPETWTKAEPMTWLETLAIFGGIPAGLFVLIVLIALAPSLIRQGGRQPGISWWAAPQWFGAQPVPVRDGESSGQASGSQVARARRVGGVGARW